MWERPVKIVRAPFEFSCAIGISQSSHHLESMSRPESLIHFRPPPSRGTSSCHLSEFTCRVPSGLMTVVVRFVVRFPLLSIKVVVLTERPDEIPPLDEEKEDDEKEDDEEDEDDPKKSSPNIDPKGKPSPRRGCTC